MGPRHREVRVPAEDHTAGVPPMPCMSLGPRSLAFCSMDRGPRDETVRGHGPFWMTRIKMRTERPTPTVEPPAGMSLPPGAKTTPRADPGPC